jgi:hypothetical protein
MKQQTLIGAIIGIIAIIVVVILVTNNTRLKRQNEILMNSNQAVESQIAKRVVATPQQNTPRDYSEKLPSQALSQNSNSNEQVNRITEIQESSAPSQKDYQFFIIDSESGVLVSNARITIMGTTFENTKSFLTYAESLPSGKYSITITAPGYKTFSGLQLSFPHNLYNNSINIEPIASANTCPDTPTNPKAFVICGYVVNENRAPVSGVRVSHSQAGFQAVTNSQGFYSAEFIPQSTYDCNSPFVITYSRNGYATKQYSMFEPGIYPSGGIKVDMRINTGTGTEYDTYEHGVCS